MPDSVEEMCPEMPRLEGLMKDIGDVTESGARYSEMPHVIEVVLPMLCNYLSNWWAKGPENADHGPSNCCTTVTSEHLSLILGNILKILNSNLGIDSAPWMKRIAGAWGRRAIYTHVRTCLGYTDTHLCKIQKHALWGFGALKWGVF